MARCRRAAGGIICGARCCRRSFQRSEQTSRGAQGGRRACQAAWALSLLIEPDPRAAPWSPGGESAPGPSWSWAARQSGLRAEPPRS